MEHRHKIRPVQLFVPSSSHPNSLRLNKGALNAVLGSSSVANRKVVVISVAGAYRKGKSFLLNFFLEYLYILQYSQKNECDVEWLNDDTHLEGFHWRCGSKRDTFGIWLWGEPILIDGRNGERYAVVLMDTQGSLEPNSSGSAHHMSSVFTLSTLLSSVQCYNVGDNISDDALENLSFLMEYGRIALSEAAQFGKPFQGHLAYPKLAFIVRDYKASEDSPFGEAGGQKLMQKAVETLSDSQSEASREIRQQLKEHFDNVFCFLLPHPGQKVAERHSFRGHVKEIRPVFRDEVKNVVQALLDPSVLIPKVINGKEVTCRKLVECIREYAGIFDSYDTPNPRSILNAHMQLVCAEYAAEAKLTYCRGMDRVLRPTRA
ncbi:Protein Y41E3.3 [Aphelenchoides avenae]|nr:Protein Y41E3.3 [Aphelenchus avenae]